MGLRDYLRKRSFSKTPEPGTLKKHVTGEHPIFVVQKHDARSLHYDLRLEIDGDLKSWAIPKGPSLNPHEHRLAIHVEDHPYDYHDFEGTIPKGQYGAGEVSIWDSGWFETPKATPKDQLSTLHRQLGKGHLTIIFHGRKLKGEFGLIKMHPGTEDNAWLLVKKIDEFATDDSATPGQDPSPTTDQSNPAPIKPMPTRVQPMLCTLAKEPFNQEGWLFEIKWDGWRAIGSKHRGKIELYSRNQKDFTGKFPPIVEALRLFSHDVVVDGEIVAVDSSGRPRFEWLQNWQRTPQGQLCYYLFDLLWYDGHDLTSWPLTQRKKLLKSVMPRSDTVRYSDDVTTRGLEFFQLIKNQKMEGIVAKRAQSPYRQNVRGPDWLKFKTHLRQEVVIGGYTEPRGSRHHLGSLLVGVYSDEGELHYVGHSGGNMTDQQLAYLQAQLAPLQRVSSPFVSPTPNSGTTVHWVKPSLVCEMSFSEWTSEGYMRHPKFEGLREDKDPKSIRREQLQPPQTGNDLPHLQMTHLDKIYFPKAKITKGDLAEYYRTVADFILPYLKDRPCSMLRMPSGITGEAFFQKNNPHLPGWVPSADIFSGSNKAELHWVVGNGLESLLYMVQLGCVEINPWSSRLNQLDKPDWGVIDLDPEGVNFKKVVETAQTVKKVCDEWGVPILPKTSGKTGLHIYFPVQAKYSYDQVKNLAHLIALEVNRRLPKTTSVERLPRKRQHKVYLDFLQNNPGQTLAAPYSVRPTPEANVSMPLRWEEINDKLQPGDFTIKNALRRLHRIGDIWQPVLGPGVDLPAVLRRIGSEKE